MEKIIIGTVPEKDLVVEMDIPEMGGTVHAVILSVTEIAICDNSSMLVCIMYGNNTLFETHCSLHCCQDYTYYSSEDELEDVLYIHYSDLVFWNVIATDCTIPSIPNTL